MGGGVIGLEAALLSAAEGIDVIVLDRDVSGVPGPGEAAWDEWARPGVAQFRQPHFLQSGGFRLLDSRLPGIAATLREQGTPFDYLSLLPSSVAGRAPRGGDERFSTVAARRPVLECAVADLARARVDIRRGVSVTGLLAGTPAVPGVPHVTGVRTASGEALAADLVIDATGRRSALPKWLAQLGARPAADEVEDIGFAYYSRFFRGSGDLPVIPGARLTTHFDCYSLLTLPGDAGTWSVTVLVSGRDRPMKELRHASKWTALVRACPSHAHLLDGEPLTGINVMSGIADRWRALCADGVPTATGVVAVGDAACATDPAIGRGMSLGLMEAASLADAIAASLDAPAELARKYHHALRERIYPWYRDTVAADLSRQQQIDSVVRGDGPLPGATATPSLAQALYTAMNVDAEAFRASAEIASVLCPAAEVFARPGLADRVLRIAADHADAPPTGPGRAEVLKLMS